MIFISSLTRIRLTSDDLSAAIDDKSNKLLMPCRDMAVNNRPGFSLLRFQRVPRVWNVPKPMQTVIHGAHGKCSSRCIELIIICSPR